MSNTVTDVVNEALDAVGANYTLGDIEDGSDSAKAALRQFVRCRKAILRSANWDFARKTEPLTLLADSSGNTPDVGTVVPVPWVYEYAYPTDCLRVRFIPWNYTNQASDVPANNIQIPSTPLTTGQAPIQRTPLRPSRFVIATDPNYVPARQGTPADWNTPGVSPQARTVILSNTRRAQCVYTFDALYPSVWDPLFRMALTAFLASELCMPIWAAKGDPKTGRALRADQIQIAKSKISEARAMDGNEATASSDLRVDWIDARFTGGSDRGAWAGYGNEGAGIYCEGYGSLPDSTVF